MEFYTIFYDYLDKRGYRRSKRIMCCGKERLQQRCKEIVELKEHKPVAIPRIYITHGVDDYVDTVDFKKALKGDL